MSQKYTCNVCGRSFPEGQGIIIEISSNKLYFHSKSCAYKFLKEIIMEADTDCINSSLKKVKKKYDEILEHLSEKAEKKI
ncbi:hypothetical protein SULI_09940 [Saccharolobus solfataricus]|uniref:TRASH domain-containing protein n=2 Tax=Saccharolobus solfataricus TaxID=2287 RepID=A0A0E3KD08_SACSO|nr:hypothetical protein [Saccharolobus solfataricus]AKA74192.1 hypothetical protein SULB_1977 [Saccharolobus solfataricus]AKA76891.1 hypothetical protein SULC_1975 [Saccharolobus solfataricus]AKA79583.1 hypothetical protein SULA_1976 [Saccharolobus solfataricus]AZF68672.1 hypothetical protein SULG_09940 [Saccharolobus solfataricus]AZF71292.1 hypothetical protein SULH_09940 [Saccharolobus solfataricus]